MSTNVTQEDIAWLWVAMGNAFGHKFMSTYGERDSGVWQAVLSDLTSHDIRYGFIRMMRDISEGERKSYQAWPPNLKEFRVYCEWRKEDFGFPGASKAFDELENHFNIGVSNWSHNALSLLAKDMDPTLFHLPTPLAYKRFRELYDDFCRDYMATKYIGATCDEYTYKQLM